MGVKLPEASEVMSMLEMLIGCPAGLKLNGGELDLAALPAGSYVSYLLDENRLPLGAFIADLPVALHLGGSMIMLPEATLNGELSSGEASEAIVDALGEIFNNLRSLMNRLEGNPHLKPTDPVLISSMSAAATSSLAAVPVKNIFGGATPYGVGNLALLSG